MAEDGGELHSLAFKGIYWQEECVFRAEMQRASEVMPLSRSERWVSWVLAIPKVDLEMIQCRLFISFPYDDGQVRLHLFPLRTHTWQIHWCPKPSLSQAVSFLILVDQPQGSILALSDRFSQFLHSGLCFREWNNLPSTYCDDFDDDSFSIDSARTHLLVCSMLAGIRRNCSDMNQEI